MSAKKRKETVEKKQKRNKQKKASEKEDLKEVIEADVSETSTDKLEVESTEELLQKERVRTQNMEDRYLRVNAEFENYKKRMLRESSDRFKFFNLDLIKELLPSMDNLERAISHAKK